MICMPLRIPPLVRTINETRPCYYDGERAMFHRWVEVREMLNESPFVGGHPAGVIADTFALIELKDGTVKKVLPEKIRFSDGGEFDSVAWRPNDDV